LNRREESEHVMYCLVSNKSSTYKLKSKKNDLICQTTLTYKSPQFISFKQLHPNLKLISLIFRVEPTPFKSLNNQTLLTYNLLVLSYLI